MYLKSGTKPSTAVCSERIERIRKALDRADAVFVGAGAGLSAASGMDYSGPRFERYFADFREKYGIQDMYSGGFYPFETPEEYWAWWSRQILINRYDAAVGQPCLDLLRLVEGKDYFILTTNVDHQFQKAGFDKKRLFYTQGDYGLWQCSAPCHARTYDNEAAVRRMAVMQRDMKIPGGLVPRCSRCGAPMAMNLRIDERFVQDEGWYAARNRYDDFVRRHQNLRAVYLELGVGFNTPDIIKLPFWQMTARNPRATYICLNLKEACCPGEIARQSICLEGDLAKALKSLLNERT